MKEHAPTTLGYMVEEVIEQTIFFRTVGIIGALAVHSGEMVVPDDKSVKPMMICNIGALAVHSGEMVVPDDKSVKPMMICNFAFEGDPISDKLVSEL